MIRSFAPNPVSIASRVPTGRQSIARRRRSTGLALGRWRFRIGCAPAYWLFSQCPAVRGQAYGTPSRPATYSLPLKGNLHMKLGVHIGYWGMGLTSEDQLTIVQEAERLGYDSVWAAEAYGSDTATVLGWLAGQTSTIRLGSGVFPMPGGSAGVARSTAPEM